MDERTAMVTIGGVEYEMLLTTRATKQIAGRYGGLELSLIHISYRTILEVAAMRLFFMPFGRWCLCEN